MHSPETSLTSRWGGYINPVWIEMLDKTPLLTRCREGIVSISELKNFLAQQYFYSRHFTRYLCALLSNLVDEDLRLRLTENLMDETGIGGGNATPHSRIYRAMLDKMGVNIKLHQPFPETQTLIETMFESCRNRNPAVGLGALCLGAEAIVPHLYSQIVSGFEANGISGERLEFFHIHIACDDDHAFTMKNIIETNFNIDSDRRTLDCSAARVISARARFFNAITHKFFQDDCEVQYAHL